MCVKSTVDQTLHAAGLRKIHEMLGGDTELSDAFFTSLSAVAPDLARYIVEFIYGQVFRRPGLTAREQEMITLAVLTAQGGSQAEITLHVKVALATGLSATQIIDVLTHCAPHAGIPRAVQAVNAAREVFVQRGLMPQPSKD